jgi:hypothetical protein
MDSSALDGKTIGALAMPADAGTDWEGLGPP